MKYTREQLEAMPDRELDAVVARVVMGRSACAEGCKGDDCYWLDSDGSVWHHGGIVLLNPSTDIAAAWEVVERMRSADYRPMLEDFRNWRVNFVGPVTDGKPVHDWRRNVEHQSLTRAISIAAVLAVQEANK